MPARIASRRTRLRAEGPAPCQPWATPKGGFRLRERAESPAPNRANPAANGSGLQPSFCSCCQTWAGACSRGKEPCSPHAATSLWPRLIGSRAFGPPSQRHGLRRSLPPGHDAGSLPLRLPAGLHRLCSLANRACVRLAAPHDLCLGSLVVVADSLSVPTPSPTPVSMLPRQGLL